MKILILICLLSLNTFAIESIPIIGVNNKGEEIWGEIPNEKYEKLLDYEMESSEQFAEEELREEVLPILSQKHLKLSAIIIGLGGQGQIGLGPFQLGLGINTQFFYNVKSNQ